MAAMIVKSNLCVKSFLWEGLLGASYTCQMDRADIAKRIDNLIGARSNATVAKALKVSREAVSQWRNGTTWPRLDKIELLALVCGTTPEYILFGIEKNARAKSVSEIRERLCQNDHELSILHAYRSASDEGKAHIVATAMSLAKQFPRPYNVKALHRSKRD